MSKVNYFEIPAKDPEKVKRFYSSVFDWQMEPWGDKYWIVTAGDKKEEGIDGAIYLSEKMKTVLNTISVPDIKEYAERVKAAGGQVMDEPHEVGEWGWHVYFKDPEGTVLGMMESKK